MPYQPSQVKTIGILTSGGDCPGLNAAIRGVAKAARDAFGAEVIGVLNGFTGLIENRIVHMSDRDLIGLLTSGGTVLGTSRIKPNKYPAQNGTFRDMTGACVETYRRLGIDCLVCIGGGGTQKNALHLKQAGLNIVTLPKTIDNDVAETDVTFGYDSAMTIATEAIDRLHTTASSHHRIMLVDIMGNNAGWLALGASLAGGADVCLIPEIPFHIDSIVAALEHRRSRGRRFSLVSVAEGAITLDSVGKKKQKIHTKKVSKSLAHEEGRHLASRELAVMLEDRLEMETRITTLGYIQRGGIPTPTDRILATQLGVKAARLMADGTFGVMIGVKGDHLEPVALEQVAGKKKTIPLDHAMIQTARLIGLNLGD
ncbi:6-phosphofructokinase [Candidatus Sumerlaeota bacterium]|nr:6-phosphofructokinase [Candidatus Sumerlaeota bacterium]